MLVGWTADYSTTYNSYTTLDVSTDKFMYTYDDALVIISAGNNG